jgi:5-methylcytosine-specific restriction endonuclease McrBC GTP-binding regulatory subunit McrB
MDQFVKDKIIEISDEILEALLAFKNEHPDFTFALRERDNSRSEVKRLEEGQWFQGSDYIYVPLFSQGDDIRRVKTIGFVLTFDVDGSIYKNYIEISFKSGNLSESEKEFHRELAESIALILDLENNGKSYYDNSNDYLQNLKSYITDFRSKAINLLKKYNLEDKYIIPESKFQKNLKRIQKIKSNMRNMVFKEIEIIYPESFKEHGQFQKNFRKELGIPTNVQKVVVRYNQVEYANLTLMRNGYGRIYFPNYGLEFRQNNPNLAGGEKINIEVGWQNSSVAKDNVENQKIENNIKMESLNQILYGPPGTGKTYSTIEKALKIIGENTKGKKRKDIKQIFENRMNEGQIVFTTFHQSMSYEDFIEGIKPNEDEGKIVYETKAGIFKLICERAESNFENSKKGNKEKLSFEDAFEMLKDEWELNPQLPFELKTEGYDFTLTGFTDTSIPFKKASGGTAHKLSINTLKEQYYGKEYGIKRGLAIYYHPVLKKLNSYSTGSVVKAKPQNYVLIIDEINRGNVSQILGELITLLEEDKRLGKEEALEVILPYSKDKFRVPPNLYIIGTMNTADRSVEALDTALRRRFIFEEIEPKPELLTPFETLRRFWIKTFGKYGLTKESYDNYETDLRKLLGLKVIDYPAYIKYGEGSSDSDSKEEFELALKGIVTFENGIDLSELLIIINQRIEILLDRDHKIGHSYFMDVYSLSDLKLCFQNKIIPLLQEYFYGDYGKIGLVLGEDFLDTKDNEKITFAKFNDYDSSGFEEQTIYKIKDLRSITDDIFLSNIISSILNN